MDGVKDNNVKYPKILNISFDHPLTLEEKEQLKGSIPQLAEIEQIYFIDKADFDTIEFIKCLLEIAPTIDDIKVQKYVLSSALSNNLSGLLGMIYSNPNTWHFSICDTFGKKEMVDLPTLREYEAYISSLLEEITDLSIVEKMLVIYDYVKLLEYDSKSISSLVDPIINKKASSLGYAKMLQQLVMRVGINCFIGQAAYDNEIYHILLVDINDPKYQIDGIYLFDPLSDSIPYDKYKNNNLRKLNYNFFLVNLDDMNYLQGEKDRLLGITSYLALKDYEFSKDRIDSLCHRDSGCELKRLENSLQDSFSNLFSRVSSSTPVTDDIIMRIIKAVRVAAYYGIDTDNLYQLILQNYQDRKRSLFKEKSDLKTALEQTK